MVLYLESFSRKNKPYFEFAKSVPKSRQTRKVLSKLSRFFGYAKVSVPDSIKRIGKMFKICLIHGLVFSLSVYSHNFSFDWFFFVFANAILITIIQ